VRVERDMNFGLRLTRTVINRPYKPIDIEIRNVTRYSYGEMTDGEFVIWAQGQAGWFEIRPATSYKSMYADMVQAVALLYFVTDIQNEPRKKGAAPSPTQIFQEVSTGAVCLFGMAWNGRQGPTMLTCHSAQKTSGSHALTQRLPPTSSTDTMRSS
jgi:hypothetical protein